MGHGTRRPFLAVFFAFAVLATQAWAGGPSLVEIHVTDNGDGDGFADTNETATITVRIQNTTGFSLTNVTARLVPDYPQWTCVTDGTIAVGDLAPGVELEPADSFSIHVSAAADRTTLGLSSLDPMAELFRVHFETDQGVFAAEPRVFGLELDLNASGGAGVTSFAETFELGLGSFEVHNMDLGLGGSVPASDSYRCQYNDPDWIASNSYNSSTCYLGFPAGQNDAIYWQTNGPASLSGGRAYEGVQSLYYGIDMGMSDGFTTPSAIVEAVRMIDPVYLPVDGSPILSFKHQVSLMDHEVINAQPGRSVDRGVVMVQVADANDDPAGPWIRIHANRNDYDSPVSDWFIGCSFDPTDDGSTEDVFFDPSDPLRRLGPSATCYPNHNFANAGNTDLPFGSGNTGDTGGPGLAGSTGPGTWVESRFDLGRFRGQRVRIRFLVSAMRTAFSTHDSAFGANNRDNGWWIDDITIDDLLVTAAMVSVDDTDNSALPAGPGGDADGDSVVDVCDNCASVANTVQTDTEFDGLGDLCDICPTVFGEPDNDVDLVCDNVDNCLGIANPTQENTDFDGFGAACDCNDTDNTIYPGAVEVNDGIDQSCDGLNDEVSGTLAYQTAGNDDRLSWPAQSGATQYQVARSDSVDFSVNCTIFAVNLATEHDDATVPSPGSIFHYLVRARKPIAGSWGADSDGTERIVPCAN